MKLSVAIEVDVRRWGRLAEGLLVAMAEEWEPDWGYIGAQTLREQQMLQGRGHREPVAGYLTYLSAARAQALPAGLAAIGRARIYRIRDGGVVVSLIDAQADSGLPTDDRVIGLARALRDAGGFDPTPIDRARIGDPEPDPPEMKFPPAPPQASPHGTKGVGYG